MSADWGAKARSLLGARGIEVEDRPEPPPGLLAAAVRACDHHCDGPDRRAEMRAECLALPTDLQQDLLDHFQAAYPATTKGKA